MEVETLKNAFANEIESGSNRVKTGSSLLLLVVQGAKSEGEAKWKTQLSGQRVALVVV